jgi:hypothetical protein
MKNENYNITINVDASAQDAVESICNVAGWWTINLEGNTKNLNDVFTVHFGKTFVTFKITEFIPDKKISWLVTDSVVHSLKDIKEWNDTKVLWDISEENGAAKITMTHVGLTPAVECYDMCKKGWNFFTGESLKKLINEGKGLPDTSTQERKSVAV